ncbi:hypothetical protein D3C80_1516330 [compost metagenome]
MHEIGMAEIIARRKGRTRHNGAQVGCILARDEFIAIEQVGGRQMRRQTGHRVRLQPIVVVHEKHMLGPGHAQSAIGGRRHALARRVGMQSQPRVALVRGGQDRLDLMRGGAVVDADQLPPPIALGEHAGQRLLQPGRTNVMHGHQNAEDGRAVRVSGHGDGRRTRRPSLQAARRGQV